MARNVMISGGGTGIGLAAAQVFAAEGDRVLLLGRRAEVLEKAGVPGALTYAADLGDVDEVRGVVGFVERELGTVDVLIHSAGGTGQLEPPVDSSDPLDAVAHNWTVNFRLNLLTAALLTEGVKERLASPGGRVLFVSSIAAYRGSGSGAYGAAKAGLHPYAHDLARELGPRGSPPMWSRRGTSRTRSSSAGPSTPLGGNGSSVTRRRGGRGRRGMSPRRFTGWRPRRRGM